MSTIIGTLSGSTEPVEGEILGSVGEYNPGELSGLVPEPVGLMQGTVMSGGERTIFVNIRDNDLDGFKFIAKGPGYLIAGAAEDAQKVLLIDATAFRSISINSSSERLSGKIKDMVSTDDYIFAIVEDSHPFRRNLYVLENQPGLAVVSTFQIDNDEMPAWLAVNEEAGLVAYPAGVGRVEIRRIAAPFDVFNSVYCVGRSAVAKWFTFASVEFGKTLPEDEDRHYLYIIADDHATASVIQYRIYTDGVTATEQLTTFGKVQFAGAQNPIRLADRACSVVTRGSVTPREPVTPVFRGVYKIANGFWATLWGYTNGNDYIVDQPRRVTGLTRNHLIGATDPNAQELLPELFASGDINEAFVLYTSGEEVKWELQSQSGGGIAVTDYDLELTEEEINTFDAFVVRQFRPGFLQYSAINPLLIRRIAETNLGKLTLNQAGIAFDNMTQVRHTVEYNDDIPDQSEWYGRDLACRKEGGALQAHADAGRASRILPPELSSELARGELFQLQPFHINIVAPIQPPEADVQASERLGRLVSIDADGSHFSGSAEFWDDGTYTSVGRVGAFFNDAGVQYFLGFIEPPADWARTNSMQFGRFNEWHPSGTMIFIASKIGPGVAIFNVAPDGDIEYWKTLSFPEYTALPDGEKANEARITPDGNTLIMACGGSGGGTMPSHSFVLQTTDDWETFELVQDITNPGTTPTNPMNTMDVSRDGNVFVASDWMENEAFVFRTTDNWASYTTHALTPPAYYPAGVASGDFLGNPCAVNYDGYRVFLGAPFGSPDYGSGVVSEAGSVEMYQFNHDTQDYDYIGPLTPPQTLLPNDHFGNCRCNYGGNRLMVGSSGLAERYLYAINDDEIELISTISGALTAGSAGGGRFAHTEDTAVIGSQFEDNGAVTSAGALALLEYEESP